VMAVAGFLMYYLATLICSGGQDPELTLRQAQTAAFTTVMLVHICYLFTARSITESAFTFSPFSNTWVLIGATLTLGLQVIIIYAPPLIGINPLRTAPLPVECWLMMLVIAIPIFFIIELEKYLTKRFKNAHT